MRAATWKCWAKDRRDQSVYLTCRELGGSLHLSLHETGQWHVAFDKVVFPKLFEPGMQPDSRFAGEWTKPEDIVRGWTLAAQIYTPATAVTSPFIEGKQISWIDQSDSHLMTEISLLLARTDAPLTEKWPGAQRMKTQFVGKFALDGGASVWLVVRYVHPRVPQMPPIRPRFAAGKKTADLSGNNLRALLWSEPSGGRIHFYEAPVNPALSRA